MSTRVEDLAKVFRGLGHPARIILIQRLGSKSVSEVANEIGAKLPAMQRHINGLLELGLIEKTDGRRYKRTDLGEEVARLVRHFGEVMPSFGNLEKEQFKKHLEQGLAKFGSGLTKQEVAKLLDEIQVGRARSRRK